MLAWERIQGTGTVIFIQKPALKSMLSQGACATKASACFFCFPRVRTVTDGYAYADVIGGMHAMAVRWVRGRLPCHLL